MTSSGLAKLGLDAATVGLFSNEFADGMTTAHRSRILGDVDENAPERWDWGGPGTPEVDAVLLLYARDEPELTALEGEQAGAPRAGLRILARLGTSDLQGHEPFGFRDGISQPLIEGLSKTARPRRPSASASSCSATRTSTATTRTGRSSTRPRTLRGYFRPIPTPAAPISGATARTSSSAS